MAPLARLQPLGRKRPAGAIGRYGLSLGPRRLELDADLDEARRWLRCALRWNAAAIDQLPADRDEDTARYQRELGLYVDPAHPWPQYWAVIEVYQAFGSAFRALGVTPLAWNWYRTAWRDAVGLSSFRGNWRAVGQGHYDSARTAGGDYPVLAENVTMAFVADPVRAWPPKHRVFLYPTGLVGVDDIVWPDAASAARYPWQGRQRGGRNDGKWSWREGAVRYSDVTRELDGESTVWRWAEWVPPLKLYFDLATDLARRGLASPDLLDEIMRDVAAYNIKTLGALGAEPPTVVASGLGARVSTADGANRLAASEHSRAFSWSGLVERFGESVALGALLGMPWDAGEVQRAIHALPGVTAGRYGVDCFGRALPTLQVLASGAPPLTERARDCEVRGQNERPDDVLAVPGRAGPPPDAGAVDVGRLVLRAAAPGVSVSIHGGSPVTLPFTFERQRPGTFDLVATRGAIRRTRSVTVRTGQTTEVVFGLDEFPMPRPGQIQIVGVPSGFVEAIVIDPGGTPLTHPVPGAFDLPAGRYTVTLENDAGQRIERQVTVSENRATTLRIAMSDFPTVQSDARPGPEGPSPSTTAGTTVEGKLRVYALAVAGAEASLDGGEWFTLPHNFFAPVGGHTLRARSPGAKRFYSRDVVLERDGSELLLSPEDLGVRAQEAQAGDDTRPPPNDDGRRPPPADESPGDDEEGSGVGTVAVVGGTLAALVLGALVWSRRR